MQQRPLNQYLALAVIGAFCAFFLIIAWNNRLSHGDDMFLYLQGQKNGLIQAITSFEFNKRYSSFFIFHVIFSGTHDLLQTKTALFIYHFIFLLIFLFATQSLSKSILAALRITEKDKVLQLTGILFIGFFFFAPQLIEIWFWPTGNVVYGIPLIFLILGTAYLLKKETGILDYLIIALSFFIVGGALETLAILTICVLLPSIYLSYTRQFPSATIKKLVIAILSTGILLALNLADGWMNSRMELEALSQQRSTGVFSIMSGFLDKNNFLLLPLLVITYQLGVDHGKHRSLDLHVHLRKIIGINIVVLILATIVTFFPLWLVFHHFGPERAWLPFYFVVFLSILTWTFILGTLWKRVLHRIGIVFCWAGLFSVLTFLIWDKSPALFAYSRSYDQMLMIVKADRTTSTEGTHVLPSLPEPEYLVRFELTNDPEHWYNQLFQECMKCPFKITSSHEKNAPTGAIIDQP